LLPTHYECLTLPSEAVFRQKQAKTEAKQEQKQKRKNSKNSDKNVLNL
jgi:hypothetical protein